MLLDIINNVPKEKSISISDIANIIIAFVNLVLAFYIFIYQRNKDKKADNSTATLNEKNIHLQWFKDIIIQPHFKILLENFDQLLALPNEFVSNTDPLYDDRINEYLEILKSKIYPIRRNLLSLFEVVDSKLFKNSITTLDKLVDNISEKLVDNRIDVIQQNVYDMFIINEILNTKKQLIKIIYSYKG